jgi:hypothetical protein
MIFGGSAQLFPLAPHLEAAYCLPTTRSTPDRYNKTKWSMELTFEKAPGYQADSSYGGTCRCCSYCRQNYTLKAFLDAAAPSPRPLHSQLPLPPSVITIRWPTLGRYHPLAPLGRYHPLAHTRSLPSAAPLGHYHPLAHTRSLPSAAPLGHYHPLAPLGHYHPLAHTRLGLSSCQGNVAYYGAGRGQA